MIAKAYAHGRKHVRALNRGTGLQPVTAPEIESPEKPVTLTAEQELLASVRASIGDTLSAREASSLLEARR